MRLKAKLTDTMLLAHLVAPDMPKDLGFLSSLYTRCRCYGSDSSTTKGHCSTAGTLEHIRVGKCTSVDDLSFNDPKGGKS